MSFTLIGTDKGNTSSLDLDTPSSTAIGDIEIIVDGVDSPGSVNNDLVDVDGFTRAHAEIRHNSDTLGFDFFYRVVTVAGITTRTVAGFPGSSCQAILAVFRHDTGGGTWGIVTPVSNNVPTNGVCLVPASGSIASEDDSLLVFHGVNDSQSTVTGAPSGMTEINSFSNIASMALFSYFENIATGGSESRTITYSASDAVIGVMAVFTYTLSGSVSLLVDDLSQSQTIDQPSLTQANILSTDDINQSQTIDSPVLTQAHILTVDDITQAQTIDIANIIQSHILSVNDLNQSQSIDEPALVARIIVDNINQAQTLDVPALVQANVLSVDNLTQAQILDNVYSGAIVVGSHKGEVLVFSAYNGIIQSTNAHTGEVKVFNAVDIT